MATRTFEDTRSRTRVPIVGVAHGAANVAAQALGYTELGIITYPALVNGAAGAVTTLHGALFTVGGFTVTDGKIVAIDLLADPERLTRIDLTTLDLDRPAR